MHKEKKIEPVMNPAPLSSCHESRLEKNEGHMPQLDFLRTVAVFAVIFSHYAPEYFTNYNWGYAGVGLFFVLSGFLITGILLRARDKNEAMGSSKFVSLKRFYIRRTLRIFPLYYATVFYCLYVSPPLRETWLWHLTYAVNFQMAMTGKWVGVTGPFWSLGVEEQFYLLWPWIVLFVPYRRFLLLMAVLVAVGPVSRLICAIGGYNDNAVFYLPTSCLDFLALGSLLAFSGHPSGKKLLGDLPVRTGAAIGLVSFVVLCALPDNYGWAGTLKAAIKPLSLSLLFVWLVSGCAKGFSGYLGRALQWQPALYLGKISYGLYVFHLVIEDIVRNKLLPLLAIGSSRLNVTVISVIATIITAALSWELFESRINRLKDRFNSG